MKEADAAAGAGDKGATVTEASNVAAQPNKESLAAILLPEELKALHLEDKPTDEHSEGKTDTEGERAGGKGASEEVRASDGDATGEEEIGEHEDDGDDLASEEDDEAARAKKANPFDDPRVQKRLGREERKRERLMKAAGLSEEEIASAQASENPIATAEQMIAQRAQRPAAAAVPNGVPRDNSLLGNLTTEAHLDQWERSAIANLQWCKANKDGATGKNNDGTERFVTPEEVAEIRENAEMVLLQAPKRRTEIQRATAQFNDLKAKADGVIAERYPQLNDPKTPEFKEILEVAGKDELLNSFLRDHPEVNADPRVRVLLARYVAGVKAEPEPEKNGKANGKVKPEIEAFLRRPPAKAPGVTGVRATSTGESAGKVTEKDVEKARERAQARSGDEESETDFVSTLRASQQKRSSAALV